MRKRNTLHVNFALTMADALFFPVDMGTRVDGTGATTRPSLNIGVPRVFTAAIGASTTVPFMKYQVVS